MDAEAPSPARPRLAVGVGAAIVLVLVVLVITVAVSALTPRGDSQVVSSTSSSSGGTDPSAPPTPGALALDAESEGADGIFVHVLGAVLRPGLYELREGDRVIDAVAAAGGYTDQADQAQLNLARVVTDGEQLYAPAVGELPPPSADTGEGTSAGGGPGDASGKVNLNTADSEALETLARVGPETAKKIIDYRQASGPFTSVDQLLEVPGIGQKTLDGFRDSVVL